MKEAIMPNYPNHPEKYPEVARAMATVYELEDINELLYAMYGQIAYLTELMESAVAYLASIDASQT